MTKYVLVFARTKEFGAENGYAGYTVLLVLKNKPSWMAGRLNLVGGKVEPGETIVEAALRELREETGLIPISQHYGVEQYDVSDVKICGQIIGVDCVIYCVRINIDYQPLCPRPEETEVVAWHRWEDVRDDSRLMPNLRVVFPLLCMDVDRWVLEDIHSSTGNSYHSVNLNFFIKEPFQNGGDQ